MRAIVRMTVAAPPVAVCQRGRRHARQPRQRLQPPRRPLRRATNERSRLLLPRAAPDLVGATDVAVRHTRTVPSTRTSWVLLAYRLPREPSTPRIALWRKLRAL